MEYKIPDNIKLICAKPQLDKPDINNEQELVKFEIVKFLKEYYLSLDKGKGNNSLANVTGIVRDDFKVLWTVYPFELDIAGRMMRSRDYTMKEGFDTSGKQEVFVIAADRDWWDKNKLWFSILILLLGTLIGSLVTPLSNLINRLINKEHQQTEVFQVKVSPKSAPILHQADSVYILEIDKTDSTKYK